MPSSSPTGTATLSGTGTLSVTPARRVVVLDRQYPALPEATRRGSVLLGDPLRVVLLGPSAVDVADRHAAQRLAASPGCSTAR